MRQQDISTAGISTSLLELVKILNRYKSVYIAEDSLYWCNSHFVVNKLNDNISFLLSTYFLTLLLSIVFVCCILWLFFSILRVSI